MDLKQLELTAPMKHSKLGLASFAFALLFYFFNLLLPSLLAGSLNSVLTSADTDNWVNTALSLYCLVSLLNPLSIILGIIALFQKNSKKLFAILGVGLSLFGCFGIASISFLLRGM